MTIARHLKYDPPLQGARPSENRELDVIRESWVGFCELDNHAAIVWASVIFYHKLHPFTTFPSSSGAGACTTRATGYQQLSHPRRRKIDSPVAAMGGNEAKERWPHRQEGNRYQGN
ncbi:unnamed protein product [Protopolystoma xenopodis]|uniref:Uncharacterized protein n=1 Tax=Protopolystoma xenopodis TaxID=117903 RepID=A0A3S5FCJ2_9PLAT|nr:unnamed protein product [Protopolystoma xenopodis]